MNARFSDNYKRTNKRNEIVCEFYLKSYSLSNFIYLLPFYVINYLPFCVVVSVKIY